MEIVSVSNNKNIFNKNILTKFKQHSKMEIILKRKVSVTPRGLMREKSPPFTWRRLFLKLFKTLELKLSPS